ncbi:putative lipid II flippase FtsW [Aeromicrobium sp. IC_218]|uniref:putative lipid II flippase FtsW n=1 Tax=Aeromicrobium sp. IC_218 TaxID=2545468 RepID=UPI001039DA32|nr:putative lipid II flippase FtsW [Aeromicrobium sp. IC_218]TCI99756.1 putative lipid II flippase FtsW [Aeromicrobium sp. IC_218]
MATSTEPARPTRHGFLAGVRSAFDRPLTSYQLVLGVGTILLCLGLVMVLSASSVLALRQHDNAFYYFERQLLFAVVGGVGAVVAAKLPFRTLHWLTYPVLIGSVALIVATYVIGVEIRGNRNWLPLAGGFMLQPSEFAKLAVVLWVAHLYSRKQKLLGRTSHVLVPMLPVTAGVALLVVGQNDLGTALVLFAVMLGMLWVAGLKSRPLMAILLTLGAVLVFFVAAAPHRVARLLTFMDPMSAPDTDGYQSIHSRMAFASGQFWGVGLGGSRQKWGTLPEAHNDFILAIIGEELGLFGACVVLVLFGLLAYAGIRIATRTREPYARYLAAGITIWLLAQALINIGMVLGLLPVIGIPLPLISSGGSSLMTTLVAVGLLVNCAKSEPGAKRALEARAARRSGRGLIGIGRRG